VKPVAPVPVAPAVPIEDIDLPAGSPFVVRPPEGRTAALTLTGGGVGNKSTADDDMKTSLPELVLQNAA
jgi:hypothetical protein